MKQKDERESRSPGSRLGRGLIVAIASIAALGPAHAQRRDVNAKLTPAQQAQMLHRHVG